MYEISKKECRLWFGYNPTKKELEALNSVPMMREIVIHRWKMSAITSLDEFLIHVNHPDPSEYGLISVLGDTQLSTKDVEGIIQAAQAILLGYVKR